MRLRQKRERSKKLLIDTAIIPFTTLSPKAVPLKTAFFFPVPHHSGGAGTLQPRYAVAI
jgi:hypothetical protein